MSIGAINSFCNVGNCINQFHTISQAFQSGPAVAQNFVKEVIQLLCDHYANEYNLLVSQINNAFGSAARSSSSLIQARTETAITAIDTLCEYLVRLSQQLPRAQRAQFWEYVRKGLKEIVPQLLHSCQGCTQGAHNAVIQHIDMIVDVMINYGY